MVVIGFVISVLRIQKVEEKNKPELLLKKYKMKIAFGDMHIL